MPNPHDSKTPALRWSLVRWYRAHHRNMPWRPTPGKCGNPYKVLVAETMLQQTQVATVVDYFRRFVARFPTVKKLAAADEQDVLHLWQGLGYYRRARNLHRAAKMIVNDFRGRIPDTVEALRQLPGVGRYTAGAIASIAFGRRAPILDGNVARVLARLFAVDDAVDTSAGQRRLWTLAERMVSRTRLHPGDINQAMMELGATVCTPDAPKCSTCPVARWCEAHNQGRVGQLPVKAARTAHREVRHDVIAVRRNGRLLVEQRPDHGLWSGMWQVVTWERHGGTKGPRDGVKDWIHQRFGLKVEINKEVGRFVHLTSHRRITFTVRCAKVKAGRLKRGVAQWRRPDDVTDLPISNAQKRVLRLIDGGKSTGRQ
jgi:A/G-specific adenine glycosylase